MAHRRNKGNSGQSPPLCMPPQRPVLESLSLSGPVLMQLPQPMVACSSRPRTPCSRLSSTFSYDEEYCNAETCCSFNSCMKSQQEFCPFGKREETQSYQRPCPVCLSRRNEEDSFKGTGREPPQTRKLVDASTDAAIRFYVDRQTSGLNIPPQAQSSCFSNSQTDDRCLNMQESAAQMSSEAPLCCGPQTDALPRPSEGSFVRKSNTCLTPNQTMSAAAGAGSIRKPCCAISDATFRSGQQEQRCTLPPSPVQQVIPNRPSSIASGTFQKLAATSTTQIKDKKRKKSQSKLDVGTGTCGQKTCPANQAGCPCRFPPAFSHLNCTGNIGGTCQCAQNK